jgi:hypothetical protein
MYKIITFCPESDLEKLIEAMSLAGAGNIGNYSHCCFYTKGTGNWKSLEGSNPTIGSVGEFSHEAEYRLEMICPKEKLKDVVNIIKKTHTYEEPEIDIFKLVDIAAIKD